MPRKEVALRAGPLLAVLLIAAASGLVCAACSGGSRGGGGAPVAAEELVAQVVTSYPHDAGASTEGLIWHQGKLYESTGITNASSLRRVDLTTGAVEQRVDLESPLYGEGLERIGGELVQLTWFDGRALVWDLGFTRLREHTYTGEGWGLCHDGARLIMSDGSDRLVFRDPVTFQPLGELRVTRDGRPQTQLNELEWAEGRLWANLWQEERILRIDPASGQVTGWVDGTGLLTPQERAASDVLSGIAWAPERGTFLITGKRWPRLFEVRFVPRP